MRLIDADELKKNLRPFSYEMDEALGNTTYEDIWFGEERIIDSMPTIDQRRFCEECQQDDCIALTRKRGKWEDARLYQNVTEPTGAYYHKCSACGFKIGNSDKRLLWKYCPNCGARMADDTD